MAAHLLLLSAVADQLGTSPTHVRKLAATGQLPSVKVGAKFLRFRQEDVDAFVRAHLRHADGAASLEGVAT